jgi:ribosomal-protein-serine acetyltransferase
MELPETIEAGRLVLRRWQPAWAEAASAAVLESLPELKPFLPWANDDYDVADSVSYIERASGNWAKGTEFDYAIFTDSGALIGSIGLMTRMGPGILEIGYWLRTSHAGRGHMTAAVTALTEVARALPGIDRVVNRHDAANGASAGVATKAGFTEVARAEVTPEAPGQTGIEVIRDHFGVRPAIP